MIWPKSPPDPPKKFPRMGKMFILEILFPRFPPPINGTGKRYNAEYRRNAYHTTKGQSHITYVRREEGKVQYPAYNFV